MQQNNIPDTLPVDQAQFEADKRAVYKHPLFSLLALMLEKCEQATQGHIPKRSTSPNGTPNSKDSDSFAKDIEAFVQMLEKENRPLLTNDSELDGLMIKALQVLRIHLLELEKVQELCRDFCTRYIACLRGKMQSENLLRSDYPLDNASLSSPNSPADLSEQDNLTAHRTGFFENNDYISANKSSDFSTLQGSYINSMQSSLSEQTTFDSAIRSPTKTDLTLTVGVHENQGQASGNDLATAHLLGGAPLGQIGCAIASEAYAHHLSFSNSSDEEESDTDSNNDDLSSNLSNNSNSKRQKRGILPKHATSVMRAWLFQHLVHPYPTEDEKRAIAAQTNLTLLQVNNWFINARRRILQPMLESNPSNSDIPSHSPPGKCSSPQPKIWSEAMSFSSDDSKLENCISRDKQAITN